MKAWLREPLVHFSLLGVGLFFLYGAIGTEEQAPTEIVVSESTVEGLAHSFQSVWDRAPTKVELDALVAEYTKDEIYYRAAVAAGLDRDDSVVRRRLRQKMEFLTAEPLGEARPTAGELDEFIAQRADRYRTAEGAILPDVRERALRDWRGERQQRANDAFYEKLKRDYSIRVEAAPNVVLLNGRNGP